MLLFLTLALVLSAIFVAGMQRALSGGWSDVVRPLVADYVDRLAAQIGSPPDLASAQALVQRLPIAIRIEGPQVQYDSHPQRTSWQAEHRYRRDDEPHETGSGWLLRTRTTTDGHRITFGLGNAAWQQQPRVIGWATLALLLLATAMAYHTVRRLFRPLDDIRAGALRFGGGDFGRPIPERRNDELGQLARQVNTMASSLQRMLDAKRGLLLAISHELRSPLTRARLNAELVAEGEPRDALLRDLAQMRDLIIDLLESERLAGGHSALQREPTSMNELVRDLVVEQFDQAAVDLQLDPALPDQSLDRVRMRLALRNLLDNALRHGGGKAALRTERSGDACEITVRDFGRGVDAQHLPHLAEAFYRADAARGRSSGGVGLGLYLCRLVVEAHGGTLELSNAMPGLQATLRLPNTPNTPQPAT